MVWGVVQINVNVRLPKVEAQLAELLAISRRTEQKAGQIMAVVKVNQEDLDALDEALDSATSALAEKIESLDLPEADLSELQANVEALRALGAPKAEAPAEDDEDEPVEADPEDEAPTPA